MFMTKAVAPATKVSMTERTSWGFGARRRAGQGGFNVTAIASRPRSRNRWWVVLASALGLFLGPIPIMVFSFGVFLQPLVQGFHSGRGAVSFARAVNGTIFAFAVPFAGHLVDRFGARRIILPSTLMAGLILLSAWLCSNHIWQLYLFYGALGAVSSGVAPVSYCAVVSHWFDRRRGLALGVMMLGLGIGAIVMPSAAQSLIARLGWRLTFAIVGAAILLVTAPVTALLLKEKPERKGIFLQRDSSHIKASSTPSAGNGM